MTINKSQDPGSKIGEHYGCATAEPEMRHRDDIIVLNISDAQADGLTHLKLTHNGHVYILQASEVVTTKANTSLDSVNSTSINGP